VKSDGGNILQKLMIALALAALGFAGNYLAVPLAYGVAFIFGSIFSIVAIRMVGPWWGIGVALAASSYTIMLWNHPYALIIFVLEALWVGVALRRGRTNLVLIDAVFWLVCGWLLVAFFYGGIMHLGLQGVGIIILKQMLNGVFNALVAAILLDHTPLRRLVGLEVQQTTYKRLIFHVICMFLMVPAFSLLLFTSYRDVTALHKSAAERVHAEASHAASDLSYWLKMHLQAADSIARLGDEYGVVPSAKLQQALAQITYLFPDFHNVFLADGGGTTVAFYPDRNQQGASTIGLNFADRAYFKKLVQTGQPVISDAFAGRGGVFKPIFSISVPVFKAGRLSHFGLGAVNLDRLIARFDEHGSKNSMIYTLLDSKKNVVFSTSIAHKPLEPLPKQKSVQMVEITPDVWLSVPGTEKNISMMQAWKGASFVSRMPVKGSDWMLEVEYPVAPMQKQLYANTISGLAVLAVLFLLLISIAAAISSYLTRPLVSLAHLSDAIPSKIENSEELAWPQSNIAEVSLLVGHFRETAAALGTMVGLMNKRLSLAATAGIGVWEWLIPENQLLFDEQMFRLYGEHEETFENTFYGWLGCIYPDDRAHFSEAITQALSGGSEYDTDFRIMRPSGELRHIKSNAMVLYSDAGDPLRMIGVNWDITGLKQTELALLEAKEAAEAAVQLKSDSLILLEQEMAKRQKADEALQNLNLSLESRIAEEVLKNREKDGMLLHQDKLASIGQLAAGVAHEINNPMGFIMGNLSTLKQYAGSLQKYCQLVENNVPDSIRPALQEARKQLDLDYILDDLTPLLAESTEGAERVRRIVMDLKDFARPDSEEMHDADLNQLIQSTINIVRNELRYVAELDLQLGELPRLVCHSQQINQVISNLLVNAAHAIETQGVITVITSHQGDHVVLVIADTGKGIPPELCSRIFDPFFTTKEVGKGTGLGLSISYDIIKKHNGEITVESEVGKGTTFTVKLPVNAANTSHAFQTQTPPNLPLTGEA
jgi:signal transduction histidine kinase